MIVLTDKEKN